jgi:hypothetical protein
MRAVERQRMQAEAEEKAAAAARVAQASQMKAMQLQAAAAERVRERRRKVQVLRGRAVVVPAPDQLFVTQLCAYCRPLLYRNASCCRAVHAPAPLPLTGHAHWACRLGHTAPADPPLCPKMGLGFSFVNLMQ